MKHVDFASQAGHQRPPIEEIERAATWQTQKLDARLLELRQSSRRPRGIGTFLGPPRYAQRAIEPIAIEPDHDLAGQTLGAAREADPVDQGYDSQLPPAFSTRGHLGSAQA